MQNAHRHTPFTKKGFTLIELMVVFVIISIIAVIILPSLLKAAGKRKLRDEDASAENVARVPVRHRTQPVAPVPKGSLPILASEDIKITLASNLHRIGMDVYTRFEASYKGIFTLVHPGAKEEPVRLDFPFPIGTTEAKDVSLKLMLGAEAMEPQGVVYHEGGISWSGQLPANTQVKAEVGFVAQGRDRFEYRLPSANRTQMIRIALQLQGSPVVVIPDEGLQPTARENGLIQWQFNNLVTERNILLELPGGQSPLGRVMLLCKLVGMAVLLFGIGFWYLAELYKPGLLHTFRWAHFFLLALTYSLFFVIFGVLGFHGDTTTLTAIGIAGILSLPLLIFHVAHVINMNFALTWTLPLAVFTLALVINGVYGGDIRDYVFIGAAFLIMAFITMTFRRWSSHREIWSKTLEQQLADRIKAFAAPVVAARELDQQAAKALLDTDPVDIASLRTEVENRRKNIMARCNEYEVIVLDLAKMQAHKDTTPYTRNALQDRISFLENWLGHERISLATALQQLQVTRDSLKSTSDHAAGKAHCLSCGYASDPTPFCPQCGTVRPRVIACQKCRHTMMIPIHLVDKKLLPGKIHCSACGENYALET